MSLLLRRSVGMRGLQLLEEQCGVVKGAMLMLSSQQIDYTIDTADTR